jgi:leader peptidase (prepilin peptidase) / N-methyltransferase
MLILFFILGLIIGSFLNAVIYRLYSGDSIISQRSKCVHCNHPLSALDLVPVLSFILLRGRCKYCGKGISWQYPAVELLTALVFSVYVYFFGASIVTVYYLLIACVLIVIAVFDLLHYLILDKVILIGLIISIAYALLADISSGCSLLNLGCSFPSGIAGAFIAAGFFGIQYWLSNGRWIGFGDVKFGLLFGMVLGFPGTIAGLLLAYMLGGWVGMLLLLSGRKSMSSQLPFGTFLAFSAIIILPFMDEVASWFNDLGNL